MALSEQYKTDVEKEINGARLVIGEHEGKETVLIIARSGGANKAYAKSMEKFGKPHRRQMTMQTLKSEVAEEIVKSAFIESQLKGWENMALSDVTGNEDDKGFAEFTEENARKLFENLPEVYAEASEFAGKISSYALEKREEEAKN